MKIYEMANLVSKIHADDKYRFSGSSIFKRENNRWTEIGRFSEYSVLESIFNGTNLDRVIVKQLLEFTRVALAK